MSCTCSSESNFLKIYDTKSSVTEKSDRTCMIMVGIVMMGKGDEQGGWAWGMRMGDGGGVHPSTEALQREYLARG